MAEQVNTMENNQIIVLFEGYCFDDKDEPEKFQRANCSCVLIKEKTGYNCIIDTMTPWDGDKIIQALRANDVNPEDINAVISTHGHSDHCGNNNLFSKAEWLIVGNCVSHSDKYLKLDLNNEPFLLTQDIEVVSTQGHTKSCISVIVRNTNISERVGICGDLFERAEDVYDEQIWLEAGSEDPEQQRKSRSFLLQKVDYIIPGHGKGFMVTEDMRQTLTNF